MLWYFADWEAVADRAPEELLSPQCLPGVSNLSLEDSQEDLKAQRTKRRGRGTFTYKKQGLYSDNQSDEPDTDDIQDTSVHQVEDMEKRNCTSVAFHIWSYLSLNLKSILVTTHHQKLRLYGILNRCKFTLISFIIFKYFPWPGFLLKW